MNRTRATCPLGELLECPEEVGVLADPRLLVVPAHLFKDGLATELRCPLCYPHEAREEPPSVEVGPDEPAFRPVFDIHRAPDASRIAHRRVDFVEQCVRQDHVRVDEDERVPVRMARTGVSRARSSSLLLSMPCTGSWITVAPLASERRRLCRPRCCCQRRLCRSQRQSDRADASRRPGSSPESKVGRPLR